MVEHVTLACAILDLILLCSLSPSLLLKDALLELAAVAPALIVKSARLFS